MENIFVYFYSVINKRFDLQSGFLTRSVFSKLYFLYKYYYEDPFAALLKKYPLLIQDGHILDVGSNIGYTINLFSQKLKKPYKVHAFEPEAKNFFMLKELVKKKRLSEYAVLNQCAVGGYEGMASLYINTSHHADHRLVNSDMKTQNNIIKVQITTIDNYCDSFLNNEKITFMKIDVQGYESEVFKGMQKLLSQDEKFPIAFEFDINTLVGAENSYFDFFNTLQITNFYKIYTISRRGELNGIDSSNKIPKGTYNFLLLPNTWNVY
jgi:FkbM family methyltransferase